MKEGRCIATPFFSLFVRSVDAPGRVAFIAGKKNGGAVWRNQAKRKLRAAWHQATATPQDYDVLLVANKKTATVSSTEIAKVLDTALNDAGLIQ